MVKIDKKWCYFHLKWCYLHLRWCYFHLRWCYLHLRWCYLRRWLGCSIDFAFSALNFVENPKKFAEIYLSDLLLFACMSRSGALLAQCKLYLLYIGCLWPQNTLGRQHSETNEYRIRLRGVEQFDLPA